MKKEKTGNELFYGVIGIATLVVAVIGATFAWFTSTGGTLAPIEIIKTGTLEIEYADGTAIVATNLKPTSLAQIQSSTNCVDAIGEEICASYKFSVKNTGSLKAVISATIAITHNPFGTGVLQYALLTGESATTADITVGTAYNGSIVGAPSGVVLNPTFTNAYTLVFWLDGPTATNADQNKTLSGTITVTANQTNYVAP